MGEKSHRVDTENKGTLFGKKTIRAHQTGNRNSSWVAINFRNFDFVELYLSQGLLASEKQGLMTN